MTGLELVKTFLSRISEEKNVRFRVGTQSVASREFFSEMNGLPVLLIGIYHEMNNIGFKRNLLDGVAIDVHPSRSGFLGFVTVFDNYRIEPSDVLLLTTMCWEGLERISMTMNMLGKLDIGSNGAKYIDLLDFLSCAQVMYGSDLGVGTSFSFKSDNKQLEAPDSQMGNMFTTLG